MRPPCSPPAPTPPVGQRRKYTDEPYIKHPEAVAALVAEVTDDPEVIAAAWLHDVVEDTKVTFSDLFFQFGQRVADLVLEVTDVSAPQHGNRATRKEIDRQHLARASAEGQTIKLADLIDNTRSIARYDPDFARTYMEEKDRLLQVLVKGNPVLLGRAAKILRVYQQDRVQQALNPAA